MPASGRQLRVLVNRAPLLTGFFNVEIPEGCSVYRVSQRYLWWPRADSKARTGWRHVNFVGPGVGAGALGGRSLVVVRVPAKAMGAYIKPVNWAGPWYKIWMYQPYTWVDI